MATVLVDENFNGAVSNTNLESFTVNNSWTRLSGASNGWVVQTTGLMRQNPQTGDGFISDSTSNQGGFVEFTLASPFVTDGDAFVALRVQDANNFYGISVAGSGAAGFRLTSVIAGVVDDTLFQGQAINGETYRIEDDGAELRVYSGSLNGEGGTLLHTEPTVLFATETGKGFVNKGSTSSTSPQWDAYKSGTLGAPPSGSIGFNTQTYRIWQRDGSGNASVTIEGTYTGSPVSLERSVNGGAWETAVASPSGNVWSDTFSLSTGQFAVAYRFSNDNLITNILLPIAVGDIFACAGQSNLSGRGFNNQTFSDSAGGVTAYLFGNDDNYKQLSDPFDSDVNQVDPVSADPSAAGSWIPRFANAWLGSREVPVGFIPCALGGSEISQWSRDVSSATLYGSMRRRILAVGGVAGVLWEQGERDSTDVVNTPAATYQAALEQFALDVQNDFGVLTYVVPLHTITLAGYSNQANIRQAQIDAASASANIEIGQSLTDIDLSGVDGIHFQSDTQLDTVGTRVFSSLFDVGTSLTITVSGVPDGVYKTKLFDNLDNTVFTGSLTYTNGVAVLSGLSQPSGTDVEGFAIDNENPHVNGAVITGTIL